MDQHFDNSQKNVRPFIGQSGRISDNLRRKFRLSSHQLPKVDGVGGKSFLKFTVTPDLNEPVNKLECSKKKQDSLSSHDTKKSKFIDINMTMQIIQRHLLSSVGGRNKMSPGSMPRYDSNTPSGSKRPHEDDELHQLTSNKKLKSPFSAKSCTSPGLARKLFNSPKKEINDSPEVFDHSNTRYYRKSEASDDSSGLFTRRRVFSERISYKPPKSPSAISTRESVGKLLYGRDQEEKIHSDSHFINESSDQGQNLVNKCENVAGIHLKRKSDETNNWREKECLQKRYSYEDERCNKNKLDSSRFSFGIATPSFLSPSSQSYSPAPFKTSDKISPYKLPSNSSTVTYNECSSEEEECWYLTPTPCPRSSQVRAILNSSSHTDTSRDDYESDGSNNSTGENNLVCPSKNPHDIRRRMLTRLLKKNFYSELVDLDTIAHMIDLRLIGKHDDWINSQLKRIFILGDSHTRFLVNGMKQILPGFRIYSFCKPSARTEQVFSGLDESISNLTKDDFLILISGTNDMWSNEKKCMRQAKRCLSQKLGSIQNTNIIVCNVPRNYSESEDSHVQGNIKEFNIFVKKTVKGCKNAVMVNLHKLKNKKFFTKHGLHFNGTGKVKICELLSHRVVDFLDKINC